MVLQTERHGKNSIMKPCIEKFCFSAGQIASIMFLPTHVIACMKRRNDYSNENFFAVHINCSKTNFLQISEAEKLIFDDS